MFGVNGERLWSSLMTLAAIGGTQRGGCNRQALTDADKAGRDLFTSWTRALGCTVTVDEVGNIFASRAGEDASAAPVLMGSHLDTQATGGRFDGVYGVMSGLEILRTLGDHRIATSRPAIAAPRRRARGLFMQCLKRTSNRVPSWRRPVRQSAWSPAYRVRTGS